MKRKGFTLIELLAVIVILAVIALIATPMILGVIDTAKQGSAKSAALGYIDAIEKKVVTSQLTATSEAPAVVVSKDDVYTVSGKTLTKKEGSAEGSTTSFTIDVKGDTASTGEVTFGEGGVIKSVSGLKFDNVYAKKVSSTDLVNFTYAD